MLNYLLCAVRAVSPHHNPVARRTWALIAIANLALAAGCADDGATNGGKCEVQVGTKANSKPSVTIPDCADKPTTLVTRDVITGSGKTAAAGSTVTVQYVGLSWSTAEQFDASWDRGGQTFDVSPLGTASVIPGWNRGLIGVKQGGRRLLIIPPALGYGSRGAGADIKPNETLVFVVDVVAVS